MLGNCTHGCMVCNRVLRDETGGWCICVCVYVTNTGMGVVKVVGLGGVTPFFFRVSVLWQGAINPR